MAPFESELKRLKKEQKELFNTIEAFEYPNTPIFDSISDRPQRNCKGKSTDAEKTKSHRIIPDEDGGL